MADWLVNGNGAGTTTNGGGVAPSQANDIATKLQIGNQIAGQLLDLFTNLFPRSVGTFTMAAAATKVVTDANVTTASFVCLMPTNAAAGTLQGSNESLYVTPASGSFTVATAAGTAAAGTETFNYAVFNPL